MRKKKRIQIPLPVNIDKQHKDLYQRKSSYNCPELFVRKYHNVFVSHEGLCLQHLRLLPYSSFNICTRYDKSFGRQYYRLVMEQYLVSTFGKSLEKITLNDNETYAVIHTKWANYTFWLLSSLVRLLMLQKSGEDFILLYPEEWDSIPYIQESLKAFPAIKCKRIPAGVHVQVKNLLLPEVRPFTACFSGCEIQMIHDYFVNRIPEQYKQQNLSDRIYVTRKKAKYRKIANEDEVVALLKKYEFSVIDFDDLNFWEQVATMSNTNIFISIHGAGFSNAIFMKQSSTVLELINEPYALQEYTFPFWKQVTLLHIRYYSQFCKPIKSTNTFIDLNTIDKGEALVNQNLVVDISLLENNILKIIAQ